MDLALAAPGRGSPRHRLRRGAGEPLPGVQGEPHAGERVVSCGCVRRAVLANRGSRTGSRRVSCPPRTAPGCAGCLVVGKARRLVRRPDRPGRAPYREFSRTGGVVQLAGDFGYPNRSSSARRCAACFSGLARLSFSRLTNFQRMAGSVAASGNPIRSKSGSAS